MTISLRMSEKDTTLIKQYAQLQNLSVSEFIRQTVMEKIEEELDIKAYNEAMEEYKKNPVTYTLEEVKRELLTDEV
ncbi:MAG: CopG family transcriptional regulator [Firmicutes bacterium]|nr:CopG family transcriptional regulator [Bacillota bacterium]